MLRRQLAWFGWGLLTYAAVYTAIRAGLYVCDPEHYSPIFRAKYLAMLGVVLTHGLTGVTALALGPFQLLGVPGPLHRRLGRVYALCVLVGSVSGLFMATRAYGGGASQLGFTLMSTLWLYTLAKGIQSARRRQIPQHRAWMIRNYSLTLAAMLLRCYLNAFAMLGFEFATVYPYVTWLSWLPTLALAELIVRKDKRNATVRRMPQARGQWRAVPGVRMPPPRGEKQTV